MIERSFFWVMGPFDVNRKDQQNWMSWILQPVQIDDGDRMRFSSGKHEDLLEVEMGRHGL